MLNQFITWLTPYVAVFGFPMALALVIVFLFFLFWLAGMFIRYGGWK